MSLSRSLSFSLSLSRFLFAFSWFSHSPSLKNSRLKNKSQKSLCSETQICLCPRHLRLSTGLLRLAFVSSSSFAFLLACLTFLVGFVAYPFFFGVLVVSPPSHPHPHTPTFPLQLLLLPPNFFFSAPPPPNDSAHTARLLACALLFGKQPPFFWCCVSEDSPFSLFVAFFWRKLAGWVL